MLINPSRQHYHQPFLTSPDRSSGSGGTTALMRNRRYQALIVGCGVLLAVLIIYQMVTAMSTETKEDGSTESPAPNRHIGRLMKDAEELERASASATTKKPETTTTTTKTQSEAIPVLPLLFTMVGRDDMKRVRELVGSLHNQRESNLDVPRIVIYGFGLTSHERGELRLWRNVDYLDAESELIAPYTVASANTTTSMTKEMSSDALKTSPVVLLNAFQLLLRKAPHGSSVVYLRSDVQFKEDRLNAVGEAIPGHGAIIIGDSATTTGAKTPLELTRFPVVGIQSGTVAEQTLVNLELQCRRGFQCEPTLRRALTASQQTLVVAARRSIDDFALRLYDGGTAWFCYLLIRDDVLYPMDFQSTVNGNIRTSVKKTAGKNVASQRTAIAIGMPTLSVGSLVSYMEVAPIRLFLPSLLTTVTEEEWKRFRYVLYIGYDEGDRYFDDPPTLAKIAETMREMVEKSGADRDVRMVFVRFPYSKGWVTYFWNGLFVHAMKDDCDYYYQVNDDLSLESNGWTSLFVDKLREMDDFGVAGPTDPMWGGRLLTQAFVSRTHYTIFGRFYPLDIRDWYSDNWMTEVYGDANTYKFSSVRARNVNDKGTRYNPCDKPKYGTVMAESQAMLEDYRTVKRVEAKSREMGVVIEGEGGGAAEGGVGSKGKLVLEARLQRALARGSLLQR